MKTGSEHAINARLEAFDNFTTGCVGFTCAVPPVPPGPPNPHPHPPSPPQPPAPPLPYSYASPVFHPGRVFADVPGSTLRDPTTALFDPVTSTWHVWCTYVKGVVGAGGYPGVVWHWSLKAARFDDPSVAWKSEGAAINASRVPGAFDAAGVFTPGAVRECTDGSGNTGSAGQPLSQRCTWYLFFGGVANEGSGHAEKVGLATASTPYGPWKRYAGNPVFSFTDTVASWCGPGKTARVDEIKPSSVQGTKYLAVKSVCSNFTALPIVYSPANQDSWGPPYVAAPATVPNPMFQANETCYRKGFEEPTLFSGPDGYLHFIGHNHGRCSDGLSYAHFVSRDHTLARWDRAHGINMAEPTLATEPVPVPTSGDGVFGNAIADKWIDFVGYRLIFSNVTWTWRHPGTAQDS